MPAKTIPQVQTERLTLRAAAEDDAAALAALLVADVSRWLASWPAPCTAEEALVKIRALRAAAAENLALAFVLADARTSAVMGLVSVSKEDRDATRAELSYWLGLDFQGRGLMREAVSAALSVAFDVLEVDVIEAGGQPANAASFGVLRALGFDRIEDRLVFAQSRNREELCHYFALRRPEA